MSFFLGAYATSPCVSSWDIAAETAYYAGLKRLTGLRGLECPFTGQVHPYDEAWLLDTLDPAWDVVLTLIPGTMDRLSLNPAFGLASCDLAGRMAALAFAEEARQAVLRLNKAAGRRRVIAVEVHSAPRRGKEGTASSVGNLTQSLIELAGWDWQGAKLVLEHCDAWRDDWQPAKGFLEFSDEIEAVHQANSAASSSIGVTINWARSVLEDRNAATAPRHVRLARQAGLLSGLIFSGCSGEATPWGVWQDTHMPHAPVDGISHFAEASLLTAEAIRETLTAVGPGLLYVGGKMTSRPVTASIDERVGLNQSMLALLSRLS